MNKFLRLTFISLLTLVCGLVSAEDTIDFTQLSITTNDTGFSLTCGNYTFTAIKNNGSNAPTQNSSAKDLRIYAKGSLEVALSSGTMTKMVFTISTAGKKRLTEITPSVGTVTIDSSAYTVTWEYATGTNDVTFTVGDNATYGTEGSSKAGQFDIDKVVITASTTGVTKKSAALAFSKVSISLEKGSEFTAPTFSKATTAEVTFSSDNESVATVNSEGVITLGGSEGTATITASSAENDEYYAGTATCKVTVYSYKVYTKATTVESGKEYLIVAQRNDSTFYAYPLGESNNYGYLSVGKIGKLTDTISVKTTYDDDFTITATTDGYTIQDCYSRYLYQSGTYNTFSVSTTNAAVWTIEAQSDGTFKIAQNGYFVQWGQGTYTTFGVYTEIQENAVLPMLYVYDEKATAGITTVKTQPAANNAIYNLAGQRVSENYRGVVIKNGKKYVQNK